jgi:cytochrome c-type biogenesis protein CcmH
MNWRLTMAIVSASLSLGLTAAGAGAQNGRYENVSLPDPGQERTAQEVMETVRCMVCQGQSVADSNADLAGDMRGLIRDRIAAGDSPATIRRWLIARYGRWVTLDPPAEPLSAPLWLVPLIAFCGGCVLLARRLRKARY